MSTTGPLQKNHYPALDGLRGVAILLIVLYHNFSFTNIFFFGWVGVDLFFVLSGFLITDILMRSVGSKNFLQHFYIRRILRIFPLYYLALLIFLVILPRLQVDLNLTFYVENQEWFWIYLQNWLFVLNDPGNTNTLNHFWSLAVEEQFYIIWPLIILLLRKPKNLLIFLICLLILNTCLRICVWNKQIEDLAYFNLFTFTRIDGLCCGCIMALFLRIDRTFIKRYTSLIVLFLATINLLFYFINRNNDFQFPYLAFAGYTTIAVLLGLLMNLIMMNEVRLINQILSTAILRFFGRISYGLYIFHWPVYLLLTPALLKFSAETANTELMLLMVSLSATIAAILISWFSYRFFEKHFLSLKEKFT